MREVLDIFSDKEKCSEIIENCYNTFSGFKDIQYEELIDMIHRMIRIKKTDSKKSELDFKKLQLKTNVFLPLIKINDFTHKILKKIHFK